MNQELWSTNAPHPLPLSPGEGRGWKRGRVLILLVLGILIGLFIRDWLGEKPASAKVVTIRSRNLEFEVATKAATIGEVLKEQGFPPHLSSPTSGEEIKEGVVNGITIRLWKQVDVILIDGGNAPLNIATQVETVSDFLNQEKIGLARTDRVSPSLETYLSQGLNIKIDRIVDLEITETHEISFETRLIDDPQLLYGHEELVSLGAEGSKEQKFVITYKNGVEIKRKLLSQKILAGPVAEIRKFGTKIEIEESREGRASWYAYQGCACAAHPYYQFGRYVRVTSLASGKSEIVKINDRGPDTSIFPDRVIDLDSVAFKALAPLGAGTIGVRVEFLKSN